MRKKQIIEDLEDALKSASFENTGFKNLWSEENDPLPKTEKEVDEFIKRRTRLYRETWIIHPIERALKALKGNNNCDICGVKAGFYCRHRY
jgi:hypothetical protein